jgi:hypothetical protein
VIDHSCPVIVLDDERLELWPIVHGLGVCGLPIMSHLIIDGKLERTPETPYEGVRILFTDLHVLGPTHKNPEQYVSALVSFIQQLIGSSTYLIVFWSGFPEDSEEAWKLLVARLRTAKADGLVPFAYRVLDKTDVKQISDDDPNVAAQAKANVQKSIAEIFDAFPQLRSLMQWETCASRAASATSNELIGKLNEGGIPFTDSEAFKATLKRMSQEALGLPHAPNYPTRGVYQALTPIAQDWLNKEAERRALDDFLQLTEETLVTLPTVAEGSSTLQSLLNDFFIHSEQSGLSPSERGAVIRLSEEFLNDKEKGLVHEVGLVGESGDWRKAICTEFFIGFSKKTPEQQKSSEEALSPKNVYVVELSADCDYAQDKPRSHRHLLALFVPLPELKSFYSKSNRSGAHEAIYATPEVTLGGVPGKLLVSCRIFLTRAYQKTIEGTTVTRLRQEVLSEIAHQYATHMRRPGKIAFF